MVSMRNRSNYADFVKKIAFKNNKMAFIAGPRQVGKTTLALQLLEATGGGGYFNWDDVEFKRQWIKDPKVLVPQAVGPRKMFVFDELHKAPRWKSSLKGVYDLRHAYADILVTGSAKLDIFRRGGDSLLGRYFLLRMHPFSLGELSGSIAKPDELEKLLKGPLASAKDIFERLFQFGGFPDPYLKADPALWNLWRRMRHERLVREDLLALTQTHEVALIESCAALLPEKVGSPFSIQSLAEDLGVSHPTTKRWLTWLSQLFYLHFVPTYSKKLSRSLRKQPKAYLWDWSEVKDEGHRFENMCAGHLLKSCHFWTDSGLGKFDLCYVRDKEKREVDFLVTWDGKPWLLAECKSSDTNIATSLLYYAKILDPPIVLQIVKTGGIHERFDLSGGKKGTLISADSFLRLF